MYNDAGGTNGPENEDLYTIYCDLYDTARRWLANGAALHLDDLVASITAIERLDKVLNMDLIGRYGPLVSGEPTVRSAFDTVRAILQEHFSRCHLAEPVLRRLRDELRSTMNDLQKAIGGLESRITDIDDLHQRIAMRKQVHLISDLQKRIRAFANTLSALHELRWESSFSSTRVQITPKQDTVYRPLQSPIMQVEVPEAVSIKAAIEGKSIVVTVEGTVRLSVVGPPSIPDVDVTKAIIDKTAGVTIVGRDEEIHLAKKGRKTKVQVTETA